MPLLVVVPTVLALILSACGGSDKNGKSTAIGAKPVIADCGTGSIAGAGSTFVQNIVQQWIKDYGNSCPGSTVNYQGVGSGAGIQQFTAGTVDFAGSDVPLVASEKAAVNAKYGDVLQIPWSAGGIAVMYKLQGVSGLQLSPDTLGGIFAGTIVKWNDPAIASDNPGSNLPAEQIQVVHRSDGSGTTAAFTSYMAATAPKVWTVGSGKDVKWPTGQGAKGSDGVTAAVKATEGTIGYAEVSFANGGNVDMSRIKNAAGYYVVPDSDGVATALNQAQVGTDLVVKPNFMADNAKAYPITTVTYVMVPSLPADAGKAKLLRSFISYALNGGQGAAKGLSYAPLPDSITTQSKPTAATIGIAPTSTSTSISIPTSTSTSVAVGTTSTTAG